MAKSLFVGVLAAITGVRDFAVRISEIPFLFSIRCLKNKILFVTFIHSEIQE